MQDATDRRNVLLMELTAHSALQVIKETIADSSRVFFSQHAKERMLERELTDRQVMRVLEHGRITEGPARAAKGNWIMTVEGISAGDRISVPVALDHDDASGNYTIIITVIRKG